MKLYLIFLISFAAVESQWFPPTVIPPNRQWFPPTVIPPNKQWLIDVIPSNRMADNAAETQGEQDRAYCRSSKDCGFGDRCCIISYDKDTGYRHWQCVSFNLADRFYCW